MDTNCLGGGIIAKRLYTRAAIEKNGRVFPRTWESIIKRWTFGLLSQMDSRAMIRTIQKWLDNIIDCYTSINSRSFSLEKISDNLLQTYE